MTAMESKKKSRIPWKIYSSRVMSGWGDRLWAFGAGIFMNLLSPDDMRLVAIYGFATSITVIIFGAIIGNWIDKTGRLTAAKVFLAIQNLTVAVTCGVLAAFFWYENDTEHEWPEEFANAVPIVTIILAIIANLASVGSQIAVEKDWIVVIAGNDKDQLARMNSVFRTIDLLCLLVAPSLAGLIFDFLDNRWAAIFIAIWNVVSVFFEYYLLVSIYNDNPELANKVYFQNKSQSELEKPASFSSIWGHFVHSLKGWVTYMKHPARNAGLGLAFLYMTVLGFDNITWGYCLSQCVTESVLGALVGVSAIFGVLGSLSFPILRRRLGLNRAGVIGVTLQLAALSMCVVSVWLQGSPFDVSYFAREDNSTSLVNNTKLEDFSRSIGEEDCQVESYASVGVFLAGVIGARFGLWITDLTITQILQEKVEEENRGVLNGVQNGFNQLMNTIKFILVIILPYSETFGWLIITSFTFVSLGAMSYLSYAFTNRKLNTPEVSSANSSDDVERF